MANVLETGMSYLQTQDPEVAACIENEFQRQKQNIELIASENIASPAVIAAMGSVLTNKYAEGYPGARYYGGCEYVDVVEQLAEAAGPVEQRDREAQPAVAGHEALLDDALDEAHVDVAAGEQAHDVFALHVDLALEHGGHGRGAGGLDDLLAALHEQEHGLGDLKIVDGDDVVGVFLDERDGDVARRLDGDAVGDGAVSYTHLTLPTTSRV